MLRWFLTSALVLGACGLADAQEPEDEADREVITLWHNRIPQTQTPVPIVVISADELIFEDEIIVDGGRQMPLLDIAGGLATPEIEPTTLTPSEVLNRQAGVNIQQGSGSESLTSVRSPVLTGGAGAGSFFYGLDGIALRAQGFANVNGFLDMPFDLTDRLEVAKGPWPVFLGTNSVHGAVNAVSGRVDEHRLKLISGSDEFTSVFAQTYYDNDVQHLSLGLSATHDGGFRTASGYDTQKLLMRHNTQLGSWELTSVVSAINLNQETAGFAQGIDAYEDETTAYANANPEAFRDVKSVLAYSEFWKDLGEYELSIKPYFRSTDMDFRLHFLPGQALERNDHTSFGIQTRLDFVTVMLGFDAEITDGHLDEFQAAPSRFSFIQGAHYDYDVKAKSFSIYGNWSPELSDKLTANLGARIEYVSYDYDNRIDSGVFGRFLRFDDQSDDFTLFLPRASLLYEINANQSVYIKAARGGRAPQTTDLYRVQRNQLTNPAKSEILDSLEAGYKGQTDNFAWELAAYTMRKDNYFFRDADGFNIADGKTKHSGIEISGDWSATEKLTLSGSLSLAEHIYNFNRIVGNSSEVIRKGNRIDTAPDVQANLRVSYEPTDASEVTLGWTHLGEYFTNAANTQDYPGHDVFEFSGTIELTDNLSLFGRVANLTDERYADRADFAFGNERYFPGRPRSLFVGVEKAF